MACSMPLASFWWLELHALHVCSTAVATNVVAPGSMYREATSRNAAYMRLYAAFNILLAGRASAQSMWVAAGCCNDCHLHCPQAQHA